MEQFLKTCQLNDICPEGSLKIYAGQFILSDHRVVTIIKNRVLNITKHSEYPFYPHCDAKDCCGESDVEDHGPLNKVVLSYPTENQINSDLPKVYPQTIYLCNVDYQELPGEYPLLPIDSLKYRMEEIKCSLCKLVMLDIGFKLEGYHLCRFCVETGFRSISQTERDQYQMDHDFWKLDETTEPDIVSLYQKLRSRLIPERCPFLLNDNSKFICGQPVLSKGTKYCDFHDRFTRSVGFEFIPLKVDSLVNYKNKLLVRMYRIDKCESDEYTKGLIIELLPDGTGKAIGVLVSPKYVCDLIADPTEEDIRIKTAESLKEIPSLVIPNIPLPSLPVPTHPSNTESPNATESYPMLNIVKKTPIKLLPETIYPISTENRRIAIELGLLV